MTTTEDRLAMLAERRNRSTALAPPQPASSASKPADGEATTSAAPPRRARRKTAAPLTRVVATGISVSAVLAGAGFLALAARAPSAATPAQGGVESSVTPINAATPPITVVVVLRPAAATGTQTTPADQATVPAAVPQATPLAATVPAPAITTKRAAAAQPVTTTKKS